MAAAGYTTVYNDALRDPELSFRRKVYTRLSNPLSAWKTSS